MRLHHLILPALFLFTVPAYAVDAILLRTGERIVTTVIDTSGEFVQAAINGQLTDIGKKDIAQMVVHGITIYYDRPTPAPEQQQNAAVQAPAEHRATVGTSSKSSWPFLSDSAEADRFFRFGIRGGFGMGFDEAEWTFHDTIQRMSDMARKRRGSFTHTPDLSYSLAGVFGLGRIFSISVLAGLTRGGATYTFLDSASHIDMSFEAWQFGPMVTFSTPTRPLRVHAGLNGAIGSMNVPWKRTYSPGIAPISGTMGGVYLVAGGFGGFEYRVQNWGIHLDALIDSRYGLMSTGGEDHTFTCIFPEDPPPTGFFDFRWYGTTGVRLPVFSLQLGVTNYF